MKNNTFDWNRFCKVVYKDFRNLWPAFGTTMLIITLLPLALWLLVLVTDPHRTVNFEPSIRLSIVVILPALASIMTPSRLYRTVNLRGEGIHFAMLPASKLEKFLSILLYTLIVCPLLVLVAGVVLDMLLYLLPFGSYRESIFSCEFAGWFDYVIGDLTGGAITMLLIASVFSHIATALLFLFTATIFRRHKVLQTFLWLWLISFVLSLVLMPLAIHFVSSGDIQHWVEYIVDNNIDETAFTTWYSAIIMVVSIVLAVLFGWLSWNRIKKMPY